MKITETIERECCQVQDLKPYHGTFNFNAKLTEADLNNIKFCVHCGKIRVAYEEVNDIGEYRTQWLEYSLDTQVISELRKGVERR